MHLGRKWLPFVPDMVSLWQRFPSVLILSFFQYKTFLFFFCLFTRSDRGFVFYLKVNLGSFFSMIIREFNGISLDNFPLKCVILDYILYIFVT